MAFRLLRFLFTVFRKLVTFRYKRDLDPDGIPQFGLVAEEVEKVNPDLVVRDEDGNVTTVRYEAVNAMLLNEFLKEHQRAVEEHRKVEEQGAMIARQQKQIEALTAGLQKVNERLERTTPTPPLLANSR
jgi:DNA-directed RNA polymerase specialized sigma54-like protein